MSFDQLKGVVEPQTEEDANRISGQEEIARWGKKDSRLGALAQSLAMFKNDPERGPIAQQNYDKRLIELGLK